MPANAVQSTTPARHSIALALAALVTVALCIQAWTSWRRDVEPLMPAGATEGSLVSVVLTTGQVFYGNLVAARAHQINLDNVYYVQTDLDAPANQRGSRLVRRQRADWHAPLRMTITADKIVMIEQVGNDSRLKQLIDQDSSASAPGPR